MKKMLMTMTLFIATCVVLIPSCKKKTDDNETIPNNTPSITSKFYFQATIDGSVVTFQDGIGGYGAGAADQSGSVPSGYQEVQGTVLTIPFSTKNTGGFSIMKTFADYPTNTEIENMYQVKTYSYGKDSPSTSEEGVDGASVYYIDNNGVMWSTDLGSADQTGSTFAITENIPNPDGYSYRISKAEFTCNLYNSSGSSIKLTNGICRSRTVLY